MEDQRAIARHGHAAQHMGGRPHPFAPWRYRPIKRGAADRGILLLNNDRSTIDISSDTILALESISDTWSAPSLGSNTNYSLVFDTKTNNYQADGSVHPAYILVLGAALNATGNLALSLDTLWATFAATVYYDNFGLINDSASKESTVVWYTTVLMPQRWIGYSIVVGLTTASMAVMLLLIGLFARQTKWSFRGQVWHTVAQVVGEETEGVILAASSLQDKEVGQLLREQEASGILTSTGRNVLTGRVEVTKRKLPTSS